MGRLLGKGTFGTVKYAKRKRTNDEFAIKILVKDELIEADMIDHVKREILILRLLDHPNIVKLHEVMASKNNIYLVMEYISGGEMFDEIVRQTKFNEESARFYFSQLVDGMAHCHSLGVCHRDLKPENLLLDEDSNLKISDFGLSALRVETNENGECVPSSSSVKERFFFHTTCGTPNYVAPEVLLQEETGYDGRVSDIWSMGCILYVFVSGYLPFDEDTDRETFEKIRKAVYIMPKGLSADCQDLIHRIFNVDPRTRITMPEIQNHPWLREKGPKDSSSLKVPADRRKSAIKNMTRASSQKRGSTRRRSSQRRQRSSVGRFTYLKRNGPKKQWNFRHEWAADVLSENATRAITFHSSKYCHRSNLLHDIEAALRMHECSHILVDDQKLSVDAELSTDSPQHETLFIKVRVTSETEGGKRAHVSKITAQIFLVNITLSGPIDECHGFFDSYMQRIESLVDGDFVTEL